MANIAFPLLDSTLTFVLAFTVTTILHEVAHAVTGFVFGSHPVLHDTFVEHFGLTEPQKAITAATGPLFSLFQGFGFYLLFNHLNNVSWLGRLFMLWMALHGLVNFFGYLINAPYTSYGDVGKVAAYLGWSRTTLFLLLILGFAANLIIGFFASPSFLELTPPHILLSSPSLRSTYLVQVAVIPWVIGAAVIIAIRFPPRFLITIIYPATSGFFTLVSWARAATLSDAVAIRPSLDRGSLLLWFIFLAVVLLLSRFVLAPGVRLGRAD